MKVYHNMPMREFIAELRDVAIQAGAGALFIDKIDELRSEEGYQKRVDDLATDLDAANDLLREVVDTWEEFDSDEEVSGADLVEWFADFRQRAKQLLK